MKIISTNLAPKAVGPYSQAVVHDNLIYLSGQICINPETGEFERDSIEIQTRRTLTNIKNILEAANSKMEHILKCNIYISSMKVFNEMNVVYEEFFPDNFPARVTVAVNSLFEDLDIEIDVIAYIQ